MWSTRRAAPSVARAQAEIAVLRDELAAKTPLAETALAGLEGHKDRLAKADAILSRLEAERKDFINVTT